MAENVITMINYPEGSLSYILSCYSREDLGVIANRQNIRGASKLKKTELIGRLTRKILDESAAAEYWMCLYDDELEIYERAMNDTVAAKPQEFDSCVYLGSGGYLFLNGEFIIEIPEEIKDLYRKVNTKEYRQARLRFQMIRSYIQAAVSLYGYIPLAELERIINSQNEKKADRGELITAYQKMDERDGAVVFMDSSFIDRSAYRSRGYVKLLELQSGKPYYVPEKEEFLKYANPGYFEETPEYLDFKRFLIEEAQIEEAVAEAACEQLHYLVMTGSDLAGLMEELEIQEIWFKSRAQLLKAREKAAALCGSTRLIQNRGYTRNELLTLQPESENREGAERPNNIIEFPGKRM